MMASEVSDNVLDVLMDRDGLSRLEAKKVINEVRDRLFAGDEDPQEVLSEELGLELDYLFDPVFWSKI